MFGCCSTLAQASRECSPRSLTQEGQTGHVVYILQRGWACSFKLLPDGSRQIITFPVPGDCVGLRSVLLRTSDHSFSALTDAVVSRVEAARMLDVFNAFPQLGAAILWATSRDEAMVVEHLVSVGRRSAIELPVFSGGRQSSAHYRRARVFLQDALDAIFYGRWVTINRSPLD